MKLLIVICLVVLATAAPPPPINKYQDNVKLLKFNYDNDGLGTYRYEFEQSDGTKQEQHGKIINEGTDDEYLLVRGSFSWVGPDGVTYTTIYEAGQDGYQPEIGEGPGSNFPPQVALSMVG